MASIKAALKDAKNLLSVEKYAEVMEITSQIMESEPDNYFAQVFHAFSLHKTGRNHEAASQYLNAMRTRPNDSQAVKGIRHVYQEMGKEGMEEFVKVSEKLARMSADSEDPSQCLKMVEETAEHARTHGSQMDYSEALRLQLPDTEFYRYLESELPHPSVTYATIADIVESEEDSQINAEIESSRTRIGAKFSQVTHSVKYKFYSSSSLPGLYQNVIDWSFDAEQRRKFEEKLFDRVEQMILVSPPHEKQQRSAHLRKLAKDMVTLKHPFIRAWKVILDWRDDEIWSSDDNFILRDFITLFPQDGIARIMTEFFSAQSKDSSDASKDITHQGDDPPTDPLNSPHEKLTLMMDALSDANDSLLGHRIMTQNLLEVSSYEFAERTARNGISLSKSLSTKFGLQFPRTLREFKSALGLALICHQGLKAFAEAKSLFEGVLAGDPDHKRSLLGLSLILEEQGNHALAIEMLEKAHRNHPSDIRIATELTWLRGKSDNSYGNALVDLKSQLSLMDGDKNRELRSMTFFRIGVCIWESDPSRAAREDRNGAYAWFLSSIKVNPKNPGPYLYLGMFYGDYARDQTRARICYQSTVGLDPTNLIAAERLVTIFATQLEWDSIEIVVNSVIESGTLQARKYGIGWDKPVVSWPYSVLGVVQINRANYQEASKNFLETLRIDPSDLKSYIGLGEAYHHTGRYNSALRALASAVEIMKPDPERFAEEWWSTKFMIANVQKELGMLGEAIEECEQILHYRPSEFGVQITLFKALVERASSYLESRMFDEAFEGCLAALSVAGNMSRESSAQSFAKWKTLADVIQIFTRIESRIADVPMSVLRGIITRDFDKDQLGLYSDLDGVDGSIFVGEPSDDDQSSLEVLIKTGIMVSKLGILASAKDNTAKSVAWCNLGSVEFDAHVLLEREKTPRAPLLGGRGKSDGGKRYLRAAVSCFKHAIELESSNSDFWCSLGAATVELNPRVAQHALIKSLRLNEKNYRAWANLGGLYTIHGQFELAHQAFLCAQSSEPQFELGWLGLGLLNRLTGNLKDSTGFEIRHAYNMSSTRALVSVTRLFVSDLFERMTEHTCHKLGGSGGERLAADRGLEDYEEQLITGILASRQYQSLRKDDTERIHLLALFLERAGGHGATELLNRLLEYVEVQYRARPGLKLQRQFARLKADLARVLLALGRYQEAGDCAEAAINLVEERSEAEPEGSDVEDPPNSLAEAPGAAGDMDRNQIRLSSFLTWGLAKFYLNAMDAALEGFVAALKEAKSSPQVIYMIAAVLWAKGGQQARETCREELLGLIEQGAQDHMHAVLMLGAICAIDRISRTNASSSAPECDQDADEIREAVMAELLNVRTCDGVELSTRAQIETVLDALLCPVPAPPPSAAGIQALFSRLDGLEADLDLPGSEDCASRLLGRDPRLPTVLAGIMLTPAAMVEWERLMLVAKEYHHPDVAPSPARLQLPEDSPHRHHLSPGAKPQTSRACASSTSTSRTSDPPSRSAIPPSPPSPSILSRAIAALHQVVLFTARQMLPSGKNNALTAPSSTTSTSCTIGPTEYARALVRSPFVTDVQSSIMIAPWSPQPWQALTAWVLFQSRV